MSSGFRSLADLLEGPPPRMDWRVTDVFPTDALGVIAGAPKSFKSFVALDLGLSVATGVPFLGTFTVDPGPVVMCIGEGGEQSLRRRATAMLAHLGGSAEDVRDVPVTVRAVDLMDPRAMAEVGQVIFGA